MLTGTVFIKPKKLEIGYSKTWFTYSKLDLGICVLFYNINSFINIPVVVHKESLLDSIRIKSGKALYVLKCRLIWEQVNFLGPVDNVIYCIRFFFILAACSLKILKDSL